MQPEAAVDELLLLVEERDSEVDGVPAAPKLGYMREVFMSRVGVIVLLIFVDMCQVSFLFTVLPSELTNYFAQRRAGHVMHCEDFGGKGQPPLPDDCVHGSSDSVLASSVSSAVGGCLTFLLSPTIGALSDSFGRRPFVLLSQFLNAIPIIMLLLFYHGYLSPFPYMAVRAVAGSIDTMSVAMAYTADLVTAENRSAAFGMVMAVMSLGILTGPTAAALLSVTSSFWASGCAAAISVAIALFFVRESLVPSLRVPMHDRRLNPFKCLSILNRTKLFRRLTACVTLQAAVLFGLLQVQPYYLQTFLHFSKPEIGVMLVLFGVCGFFANSVLLKLLGRCLTDKRILVLALAAGMLERICMGLARNAAMVFIFISVLGSMGFLAFPVITSLKSNNVSQKEQGLVQGALYGARSLAAAAGPIVFGGVYSLTKGAGSPVHLPQAVFYVGALFAAAALAVATTLPNSGQAKDLASPVPQESDGSEDGEAEAEGGSVDPEAGSEPSPAQRAARRGSE